MILLKKAVHFANKFLTVKWLLLLSGDCRSIEEISKNISANNIYLWCDVSKNLDVIFQPKICIVAYLHIKVQAD